MENKNLLEIQKLNALFSQKEREFADQKTSLIQSLESQKLEFYSAQTELQMLKKQESELIVHKQELEAELLKLRESADAQRHSIENQHKEAVTELSNEYTKREENLITQIENIRTELKAQTELSAEHLAALARREKEWNGREQSINGLIMQMQDSKHAEAKNHLMSLVQREKEFAVELIKLRESSEEQRHSIESQHKEAITELSNEYTKREENLITQIENIRTELKVQTDRVSEYLATLAQREKEFADERKQSSDEKHAMELKISDLSHLLTITQQLELQLNGELALRQQMLNELSQELAQIRGSLSWRFTTPLRAIGTLFTSSHPDSKVVSRMTKDLEESSVQAQESVAVIDSFANATVEEPVISKPEQPIINTKEIFMQSSPTVAATSLDNLLAFYDADFIYCAYMTLLGRVPDPEGMNYYLHRLRNGISKIEVLAQLYKSNEAKIFNSKLAGLNTVIKTFEKGSIPLIGWMFRLTNRIEDNKTIDQRLRMIENQYYINHQQLTQRLNHIDESLLTVKGLIIRQLSISQNSDSSSNSILKNIDSVEPIVHDWSIPHNEDVLWQLQSALNKKKV